MKIIKCCIAAYLVFALGQAYAQQASVAGQGYYDESDFGKFYLRIGINLPQGHLKNKFDPAIPVYENMGKNGGMQASTGFNFELGRYFFFHEDPIHDLFKVGLDATFLSLGYNAFEWPALPSSSGSGKYDLTTIAVKFGPVVSFNVFEDVYADVFAKFAPTVVSSFEAPDFYIEDGSGNYTEFSFYSDNPILFGWKGDFGVNLRYKKGTLTLGYESGSFNTKSYYYVSDGAGTEDGGIFEQKMPMGIFQVRLGVQFQ
ncbi:hypothetical protein [Parapedobacter koreensis]|uniref:Outer membrane protein beta-barrel domain-containing protein n=1 Tax=Parapedobacter koreensis TaxID=332977 RepID=A0A1H7U0J9_9SPHI|nr:hypothetical protein [Parapedobacter koreensis]SEL90463.1 hypothetical protein SAMN05421740_11322 [Parapedobacter koreensis]